MGMDKGCGWGSPASGVLPGLRHSACHSRDPGLWRPELQHMHPVWEYVQFFMAREHSFAAAHGGRPSQGKGLCSWYHLWRTTPQKP